MADAAGAEALAGLDSVAALHRYAAQLGYAVRAARRAGVDRLFLDPALEALAKIGAACSPSAAVRAPSANLCLARPDVASAAPLLAALAVRVPPPCQSQPHHQHDPLMTHDPWSRTAAPATTPATTNKPADKEQPTEPKKPDEVQPTTEDEKAGLSQQPFAAPEAPLDAEPSTHAAQETQTEVSFPDHLEVLTFIKQTDLDQVMAGSKTLIAELKQLRQQQQQQHLELQKKYGLQAQLLSELRRRLGGAGAEPAGDDEQDNLCLPTFVKTGEPTDADERMDEEIKGSP